MKTKGKRFLSLLMAVAITLSVIAVPASADSISDKYYELKREVSAYYSRQISRALAEALVSGSNAGNAIKQGLEAQRDKALAELDAAEQAEREAAEREAEEQANANILESGVCGKNLKWTLYKDYTLIITGTGAMYDFGGDSDVDWVKWPTSVKSVVFDSGVTSIGASAFSLCKELESVTTLGSSIKTVGDYAFAWCENLESMWIPDGATSIGKWAFYGCKSLESVRFADSVEEIGEKAFYGCENLGYTILPQSLKNIYAETFYNCNSMERIKIPESVETVYAYAFMSCDNLEAVFFLGTNTHLEHGAFGGCDNLTIYAYFDKTGTSEIEDVAKIDGHSFSRMYTDEEINNQNNGTDIQATETPNVENLYGLCGDSVIWTLTDNTLTILGKGAMWDYPDDGIFPEYYDYWEDIEHLVILSGVTYIGQYAFAFLENLEDATIADSVTIIGEGAFQDCTWLSRVTLPDTLQEIRDIAFVDCANLSRLDIPASVNVMGDYCYGYGETDDGEVYYYNACIYGENDSAAKEYATSNLIDFVPISSGDMPFTDVKTGSWYYDAVCYAYKEGLISGITNTTFEPQTKLTRAMFVTILGRSCGITVDYPQAGAMHFSDVKSGSWYAPYVAWAADNGIVNGISDYEFGASQYISREQMATMIARYIETYGYQLADSDSAVAGYGDQNQVASYARAGLELMRRTGIITGDNYGNFNPKNSATRAEAAVVFQRLTEAVAASLEQPDETASPEPSTTPTPSVTPEPSESVEPSATPEPSESVEPSASPEPSESVEPSATPEPSESAEPSESPEPSEDVEPSEDPEPSDTPTPAADSAKTVANTLSVDGTDYYLGMDASELDTPDETVDNSVYGFPWYVYGTDDYTDFFAAGVENGKVVALMSVGKGFRYQGMECGDQLGSYTGGNDLAIYIATDKNDNNIVHGVLLVADNAGNGTDTSKEALAGESKLNFHCTNAFRVYHGKSILKWSEGAATAARLHSEDMASNNYFNHTSMDNTPYYERIEVQVGNCYSSSENICAGRTSGFAAYDGWVNSAGHRTNMLTETCNYLGVGFGFSSSSQYHFYATQDFYYQ